MSEKDEIYRVHKDIEIMEAQKRRELEEMQRMGMGHPDRRNIEQYSDGELRTLEAQIKQNREDRQKQPSLHPDRRNIEQYSDEELRTLEAQIKQNREDRQKQPSLHPDRRNIEQFSNEELKSFEAQVKERREVDLPYKEYFKSLMSNPNITNAEDFGKAVMRSTQSNGLIEYFISNIHSEINNRIYQLKTIKRDDIVAIEAKKTELEKYIELYEKFLYKLKEFRWDFKTMGSSLDNMKFPETVLNDLWNVQKDLNITFKMPIPANLGEYYGNKFTRNGKMIPGINLMYQELMGNEVNWHQVLIYKEGELTPYQLFQKNQEEKRKAFETARQQEISQMTLQLNQENNKGVAKGGR